MEKRKNDYVTEVLQLQRVLSKWRKTEKSRKQSSTQHIFGAPKVEHFQLPSFHKITCF